jgi:hypothetical protein
MFKSGVATALLLATISLWATAYADVLLRYTPDGKPPTDTTTDNLDLYVTSTRVLMTGRGHDARTYSVWYDSAKDNFTLLDAQRKGYFELRASMFDGLKQQQAQLRADMEQQLQTSPPENHAKIRSFVEHLEAKQYGGPPLGEIRFTAAGGTSTVAGYNCDKYDVFVGETKARELCVAKYETLGVGRGDRGILDQMHQTALALAGSVRRVADMMPRFPVDMPDGLPLEIVYLNPTGKPTKLILAAVEKKRIEEEVFDLPAGYKPVSTPGWVF